VHVFQYNNQNLALANMAKSANDNMMTIDLSWRVFTSGTLSPRLRRAGLLSWSGDGSAQWYPGAKPRLRRLGVSRLGTRRRQCLHKV